MGKPHVPERLDALIGLGAEDIARDAAHDAEVCLDALPGEH